MKWWIGQQSIALALFPLCLLVMAAPVRAAEFPPQFEPLLSLTGDCSTSALDPIPDPGCPDPPHPPSGRFNDPRSIAVDPYGNEYVASVAAGIGWIDVFDDEGRFITELAGVNRPYGMAIDGEGNLYVFERASETRVIALYVPSTYEPALGKIDYLNPKTVIATTGAIEGGLAVDIADTDITNDHLFSGQGGSIKVFGSVGEGNALLHTITNPKLKSNVWVAVDSQRRRLYASYCKGANGISECGILVFDADPPFALLKEVDGSNVPAGHFVSWKGWLSVAVDEETGHFFVDDLEASKNVYEFDQNYNFVSKLTFSAFEAGKYAITIGLSNSRLNPSANNRNYLFVPVLLPDGRALAFKPPSVTAPDVEAETLAVSGIGETEATIGARIDPNGGDTTYTIAIEAAGSGEPRVSGAGTIIGSSLGKQVAAVMPDLLPATSYTFRVKAENAAGEDVEEGSFRTYSDAPARSAGCPNGALRTGLSAVLPDCRAYELVTPPDTNGHPTKGIGFNGDPFTTLEASPLGETVSFNLEGGALPGTEANGGADGDHYRATRDDGGWSTVALGPSGAVAPSSHPGSTSPDGGFAFWNTAGPAPSIPQGQYVQYPDGHSELVGRGALGTDPTAHGVLITEAGTHIVFRTRNFTGSTAVQLELEAPPATAVVYDRTSDEVTHVVSLLPGNVPPEEGEDASYLNASADGEGIAFEIEGTLYLRVDNASTYEIGKGLTFAGVAEGGRRIFYIKAGDLFAFDTDLHGAIAFSATGDVTPVNVAPDGSRAYFISPTAIPGIAANPNGDLPQAGSQNLYLSEEGEIEFVATVTDRDVEGEKTSGGFDVDGLGLWVEGLLSRQPAIDPSRLNPDGSVFLFQSRASLDQYEPGEAPELYRYDSVGNRLHCISCIPTGGVATGGASLQTSARSPLEPQPFSSYGFVPNIRFDGRRVFFESTEALVARDTDGVRDIYEWEDDGVGSCNRAGGCVYLISSGHSAKDNFLYGVSYDGDDVFFTTADQLTDADATSTISIYDARVGGGFATSVQFPCSGEGCKPPLTPPPTISLPPRPALGRADNLARACPRGMHRAKRQGKGRCVKKKQRKRRHRRRAASRSGKGASK